METIADLKNSLPQRGVVRWIGIRPARREQLTELNEAVAVADKGLEGDHFAGRPGSSRQVTLIQAEHLDAVASIMATESIDPGLTRRNIVVGGINLLSLKDRTFRVGNAVFMGSGECHPCSRMEENLGAGGYNAMRGHGGITAMVVTGGAIAVGDEVALEQS